MNKLSSLLAFVVAVLLLSSTASAVEYGGVGGKPANPQPNNPRTQSIFIYELKPGQQATDAVKVYNNTSTTRTVEIGAVDSILSSGGAFACAQLADPKTDVGNWINLSSTSVTVPANGNESIPFTVTVPSNAGVGEHDGCITLQDTTATTQTSKSGVILSFRSAMRVVVTVPGQIVKKLTLASVKTGKLQDGNYQVTPIAKNDGNVSLDATVSAVLQSVFGGSSPAAHGTYPVLPHSAASWNLELKHPFWGGWYRAQAIVVYNSNPTATLGQNQGAEQTERLASALFFAAPEPVAGVIEAIIILIVLAIIIWLVRKWRHAIHVRQHWQEYSVTRGDKLQDLAHTYGVSWKKIATVNKLKPPYDLHKGQKLKLPVKPKE